MDADQILGSNEFDDCCVSCAIMDAAEKLGRHPTPEEMKRIYIKTVRRAKWKKADGKQVGK